MVTKIRVGSFPGALCYEEQTRVRVIELQMLPIGGLFAAAAGGPEQPGSCNAGQQMILRRLDRLEEICSRTESYLHMVLGTLDRRLQMLEADALSARRGSTQDSMTSPRFPTVSGVGLSCEAGTLVTPEMLMMVQSPRHDRVPLFAAGGLPLEVSVPTEEAAATECLSPIPDEDSLPTPVLIPLMATTTSISTAAEPLLDVPSPPAEDPFSSAAALRRENEQEIGVGLGLGLDEVSASTITMAPFFAAREREIEERQTEEDDEAVAEDVAGSSNGQVSAIAIFSLASPDAAVGHENPMDALLCEPVLTWENDGFPYLRPAYQFPRGRDLLEPSLRDTTVLTWEAATYLSPESVAAGSEDDRATSRSSEEDEYSTFSMTTHVDDLEEVSAARLHQRQQQHEIQRKEDSMLAEISSILQNICSNLESLKTPEASAATSSSSSGSCPHCRHESAAEETGTATAGFALIHEMVSNPREQEEILSVIEGMFRKLSFSPRAEDVLVSILPGGEASSRKATGGDMRRDVNEDGSSACSSRGHYHYAELPQHNEDEEMSSGKAEEGNFQSFPLDVSGSVVQRAAAPGGEEEQEKKERIATVVLQKIDGDSKQMVVTTPLRACCSAACAAASHGSLEDYLAAVGNEEKEHDVDRPMAFNWEGIPASGECEDIPCLLKVEDRKVAGKDEITPVGQEVCLSMDVPPTPTAAERSTREGSAGVHIGISLKPVATTRGGDEEGTNAISCVEIPEEKPFEKVPFAEMAPLAERPLEAAKEELEPLKNAAVPEQKTPLLIIDNKCLAIEELVDSILAPPPSPVEAEAGTDAEVENLPTTPTPVEAVPPPETYDYLFKEEEEKKSGTLEDEWVIDAVFLPKDNFQQVEAKVPKPVLKGMTPLDLIRGSLHFDGKACLLSISIDEIWSTEDMCQAPASAAAALAKQKSLLDTLCADKSISGFGAFVKQQDEGMNKKKQQQGFGFRQLKPKPAQAAVTATATFGFRSLQGKQLLPTKSLEHLQPLATTLPETPVRAPDSPAARSCIIDGDPTESPVVAAPELPVTKQLGIAASTSTSTPVESDQEQEEQATPPLPAPVVEGGGSGGEEDIVETQGWSFPLDASGGTHESETFFDALQCSAAAARNGGNKKFKRYLKDKLWSRLACYGFGLPESEASDAPCHHDTPRSM